MNNPKPLLQRLRSRFFLISLSVLAIAGTLFFSIGKTSDHRMRLPDPAFAAYISAHTSGSISRESAIRVQLTGDYADSNMVGEAADVFDFDPDIKGEARWVDASTIEFKPASVLPSGQEYSVDFNLSKITKVSKELETFSFYFSVVKQSFEVSEPRFKAIDGQKFIYQQVSGTLSTADVEESALVEKLLQATYDGNSCRIRWEHTSDKKTHRYFIDSLTRKGSATDVKINWNGSPLDLDLKGEHKLTIPALGDFSAVDAQMRFDGSQYISLYFSDPILPSQDLTGLIHFDRNMKDGNNVQIGLRYFINGHEVRCYPSVTLSGTYQLFIEPGVQNLASYKLKKAQTFVLNFADQLPGVKILGKGVIIPASNKILMPFEAVCLNAVDVAITKIYEQNVVQFMQVNDLKGSNEMHRVGKTILKKRIALDKDKLTDLRKPNVFQLNLDELIKTEPGAIYQIKLSFKKEYSLYQCNGVVPSMYNNETQKLETEEPEEEESPREYSYWDYEDEYYSNNFNWQDRDNPCTESYYNFQRWQTRNIMASDLGIIAKKGQNNKLLVAVTNLISTDPMAEVSLDVMDYRRQSIGTGKTDGNGMAQIAVSGKPFILVASYKNQKGYLKLDDGSSLSVSQFEVWGDVVQKGLKGFLYGERGVWRPGDSLYLTFMLEDKNKTLPPMYPVTLELYTPMGSLYKRMVQPVSLNGFYDFRTCTDPEAITGNYLAKVKVGGVVFQKNLKIETVIPNRLKIDISYPKPYIENEGKEMITLRSKWLHGAIAGGLDAKVDLTLGSAPTQFKRFPDYVFDNPCRYTTPTAQTIFEGKLNAAGEAQFAANFKVEEKPAGMLNAYFTTKVFEPGGAFSIDRYSIPFHYYNSYIGIRLPKGDAARNMFLTDTNHTVQVVCVNPEGNVKLGTRKATARLYKIDWRWWWDKNQNDLGNYANAEEYSNIMEKEVVITNGIGRFTFRVNYPDWGRYLLIVTDEEGHSTGKTMYIDWPGWAGRGDRDNSLEASMLSFNLNKTQFKVGETATLTIPTPAAGRALLSIESGTEVLETHWIQAQKGQTTYSFTVTKNMMPNVYAHVTLVQPHAQSVNDRPVRMYGMQALMVEDPLCRLQPVINMAAQIRPDVDNTVTISEASGKAMTYTLAVVDEGLLDLTRYKTPDPYAHFYAREALGVKTWDLYDYVMGAFGSQFNRILSIGGDEGINRKSNLNKAKRFKPVVTFLGPYHIQAGQSGVHKINIKDYVGSVRVMVVAGYNGAYGSAEKAVPVKKPLMVLATLPRVLRPGEEVNLPVNVFAMDPAMKQVSVKVSTNALMEVNGPDQKVVKFAAAGDEIVNFSLRVKKDMGIAKARIVVSSGAEQATTEVELDISNPNPYETNVYNAQLENGKPSEIKYDVPGIDGTNTAVLEVSALPPMNLEKRLKYLIHYPYGCVEQTTSSAFPQLYMNKFIDVSKAEAERIEQNVKAGIRRLASFQNTDGGLGYWPGEPNADEWGTSYAGHFMLEAQQNGYVLPPDFLRNWRLYQQNKASSFVPNPKHHGESVQAYRLYTLALARYPDLGAMNRLKEVANLTPATRWRLAAAYVLAGNRGAALELIGSEKAVVGTVHTLEMEYTYGSPQRDEAMMLETLGLLGEKDKIYPVLTKVCSNLGSEMYMSTQSTAYSLLAIATAVGKISDNKSLDFEYTLNGKETSYRGKTQVARINLPVNGDKGGKINLRSKSNQMLFARVITRGQPAIGKQTAVESNIKMEVVYKTMKDEPLDPSRIPQGTDFKVEVTISNPGQMGNYNFVALSQMFPSGWEIHNSRMDEINANPRYAQARYTDIRDDRVYTHFDLAANRKVTFVVLLNASYLGKFYLPGFSCETMYYGPVFARTEGSWVEVVPK